MEQRRCSPALVEAEDAEKLVAFCLFDTVRFLVNVEVVGPRVRSCQVRRGCSQVSFLLHREVYV